MMALGPTWTSGARVAPGWMMAVGWIIARPKGHPRAKRSGARTRGTAAVQAITARRSTAITAIDSTVALVSGSFIAYKTLPNIHQAVLIIACCFFAVLPDVMEGPYFFLHQKTKWIQKWISFQKSLQSDTTWYFGLLTQLLTIGAVILWLRN